jgi:hypothetical protein
LKTTVEKGALFLTVRGFTLHLKAQIGYSLGPQKVHKPVKFMGQSISPP